MGWRYWTFSDYISKVNFETLLVPQYWCLGHNFFTTYTSFNVNVWKKSIVLRLALFSLIVNYLHVKKDSALHFINLEYPFHKDALYKVWLNLGKWFLRRRQKCKKLQTDERTDKRTGGRQTTSVLVCREKYLEKI